MLDWVLASLAGFGLGLWLGAAPAQHPSDPPAPRPAISELDRMAFAVEGVESSHGIDPAMWQQRWSGPQGPMQVTHAAALDVGGGNRFDPSENRQIGRAYLAAMHRRYGNWADALAAYNWGPGNLDRWIAAGRPAEILSVEVRAYLDRVLRGFVGGGAARPQLIRLPPAEPPPPDIHDPRLRKAFDRNDDAIKQLRRFLAGGDDAAGTQELMHRLAQRPGYEEFRAWRAGKQFDRIDKASLQSMTRVLLEKLHTENAAIATVDQHRRGALR